jgi:hypothetical protein
VSYEGVPFKDLGRTIEMEYMGIAAWRSANDVEHGADPEARLRIVAAQNPHAAAAFGLLNAGAAWIVAIDESGAPLTAPTRDPDTLASWWEPGGTFVNKWPGVPCGPAGGYVGLLLFPGEGMDWLRKIATVHTPSRAERLISRSADPVDELGVPRPGGDDWDDDEPRKPDEVRAPMAARLWLVEDVPAHRSTMQTWFGSLRGRMGQAAMAAAKPSQPRQVTGMVWSWPPGQMLPVGRKLRKGVESLAAIPALGAVLNMDGVRFVVRQSPSLISPPPDWLVSELQRLGNG